MNKIVCVILLTAVTLFVVPADAGDKAPSSHGLAFQRVDSVEITAALKQTIIEETAQPVRPGIPGKQPFWNVKSKGFTYAPAFDFKLVAGATSYRFKVEPKSGGQTLMFETNAPWAALSPVWKQVPVGFVKLTVEGMASGKITGVAGTCNFYRNAVFEGQGSAAVRGYKECGILELKRVYESSHVRYWLDHDSPDPRYEHYCYPSKMIGSVLTGLTRYSQINPEAREDALKMARNAADFLIRVSEPENSFYAFFPPTYRGDKLAAKNQNESIIIIYPAEAAAGYLDLYDATRIKRYFEAAMRIADTYAKTQLKNGTWPIKVNAKTGAVINNNPRIPIEEFHLFQRLDKQYGCTKFRTNQKMAMDWIIANPIRTFNWDGQFEDTPLQSPYNNLAKGDACNIAIYMLENANDNPQYEQWALEIIRYAEDQFVVWNHPNPDLNPRQWLIPCALEQYSFMMPINASAVDVILAWAAAYKRTGQEIFRLKARTMANVLTVSQLPSGELPTGWTPAAHVGSWLNCSIMSAMGMIALEEAGIQAVLPKKK